ncbi:MAG: respiratory chain complex I subunit 1 family protein [Thermoanaerobacteraceae bacterium]
MSIINILIFIAAILITPIIGGFLSGIDRKVTALIQGRYGPPIRQPFYDVIKLLYKQKLLVNNLQVFSAYIYLLSAMLSIGLLAIKADLLMIIFVMSVGVVFYIAGALSAKSSYSQVGAQRELMQMLAYEPILIFFVIAVYNVTGSFNIGEIMMHKTLLADLPLIFLLLGLVLTIKLKKSPFDLSSSEHAHQELVRGILTDYSGPYLALIHLGDWYEMVFILALIALMWSANLFIGALIALAVFFVDIIIDNITARLTVRWMLEFSWAISILFTVVNIAYIYFRR